jgi:ribosomal protein L16 Arg81 hydroxylase
MMPVAELPGDVPFEVFFHEHIEKKRPCVLRSAARSWPATARWTPDFFSNRYGQVLVDFVDTTSGARPQHPLGSYFGLAEPERSRTYVCDWDFRKCAPELLQDLGTLPQFSVDWIEALPERLRPDLMWIYIGHAGTAGPTHLDNLGTSAWLAVLDGRKRLRFCWPDKGQMPARVDLFSEPSTMDVQEACLEAGDVVYVPSLTWHAARNDTYCVSVTANFIDGGNLEDYHSTLSRTVHDRRVLVTRLNALEDRSQADARKREIVHLELALRRYRARLEHDLLELADFEAALAEHRQ